MRKRYFGLPILHIGQEKTPTAHPTSAMSRDIKT